MTTNFFSPLCFVAVFGSGIRDPGSEIRDPRSGIRDPGSEIRDPRSGIRYTGGVKIRIRDKHPGSATLLEAKCAKTAGRIKSSKFIGASKKFTIKYCNSKLIQNFETLSAHTKNSDFIS